MTSPGGGGIAASACLPIDPPYVGVLRRVAPCKVLTRWRRSIEKLIKPKSHGAAVFHFDYYIEQLYSSVRCGDRATLTGMAIPLFEDVIQDVRLCIGNKTYPGKIFTRSEAKKTGQRISMRSWSIPFPVCPGENHLKIQVCLKNTGWKALINACFEVKPGEVFAQEERSQYKLLRQKGDPKKKTDSNGRILLIAHDLSLTGAPVMLLNLATALVARGYGVVLLSSRDGPMRADFEKKGVPVQLSPAFYLQQSHEFQAVQGFDVVVANALLTFEAVLNAARHAIPVLWWMHDHEAGVTLMSVSERMQQAYALADRVIFPARATASLFDGLAARPTDILFCGFPDPGPALPEKGSFIRFLQMGTICPRKGQDITVEACQELEGDFFRAGASLEICGYIQSPSYQDACVARSSGLNIQWTREVARDGVMDKLRSCDVLIMPSRDEVMPVVILEAFALGKVVIASRVGAIDEFIQDGENGFLIEPENSHALAGKMRFCRDNPEMVRRLGQKARDTYEKSHTLDRMGQAFEDLIQELKRQKSACADDGLTRANGTAEL